MVLDKERKKRVEDVLGGRDRERERVESDVGSVWSKWER
jgi:hypothetical protein